MLRLLLQRRQLSAALATAQGAAADADARQSEACLRTLCVWAAFQCVGLTLPHRLMWHLAAGRA